MDAPYFAAILQLPLHGHNAHERPRDVIARNIARVCGVIERIVHSSDVPPKLFALPVLAFSGIGTTARKLGIDLAVDRDQVAIDWTSDPILDPVRELCRNDGVYLATSHPEKNAKLPGRVFHTGFIMGPQGLVLRNPKTQAPTSPGVTLLRDNLDEYRAVFGADAVLPVAATPIGTLGILVEGEYLVPETVRTLASKGAEVILHPTAHHAEPGRPPTPAIQQAHAYVNAVYWVSGCISREVIQLESGPAQYQYGGGAVACGPDGAILAQMGTRHEGYALAPIDLEHLRRVRPEQAGHTKPAAGLYRDLYA
jgi:predicted amidohydrolase